MRGGDIRFDTFQTKTDSTREKTTHDGVGEEVLHTVSIGFDGGKGENGCSNSVATALEEARFTWLKQRDPKALRAELLTLLMDLD